MPAEEPVSLKQVQLRLGVPQHVLIHLCDKGVVEPDFADAGGRGKRRKFSQRNVFEFGVALTLRRFEISVAETALVVRLLRSFEDAIRRTVASFALAPALVGGRLKLSLNLFDGDRLVLDASGPALRKALILGVSLRTAATPPATPPRVESLGGLPSEFDARIEINLTRIAARVLKAD